MKVVMKLLLFLFVALCLVGSASALQIVPGLYGFGTDTRAAYGAANDPEICIVDSLATTSGDPSWNASGYTVGVYEGTFMQCVNLNTTSGGTIDGHTISANSGKVVLFGVSGTIGSAVSTTAYNFEHNYTSILGQSAPSPGILLKNSQVWIRTHDVFMQHLRIRGVTDIAKDPLYIGPKPDRDPVIDVVLDHMSISWGLDETVLIAHYTEEEIHDITFSNGIVAEGIWDAAEVGKCFAIASNPPNSQLYNVSVINTMMGGSEHRHPQMNSVKVALVNNYVYNAGNRATTMIGYGYPMYLSSVGNVIEGGPYSGVYAENNIFSTYTSVAAQWDYASTSKIYSIDNNCSSGVQSAENNWDLVDDRPYGDIESVAVCATKPLWPTGLVEIASSATKKNVLDNSGCRPADRDSVDTRLVGEAWNGTGISSRLEAVPGWPTLAENNITLSIPANPHTDSGDGYTNLEIWLHGLADEVEGTAETSHFDNTIKSTNPNTTYNGAWNGAGRIIDSRYRSLIWFNLSEYNSTDTITNANLSLFWYAIPSGRNKSTNVGIYFSNATIDTEYLTWNNSSNGVAWREPGGNWLDANWVDNGTTPFDSELFPNTAADESFHTFDITELVQAIVNESRTNNGFFIIANETNTNYIAFSSFDNATEAHRPTLNITHSIAGADTPETSDFTYYKIITINQTMVNQSIGTGTYPLLVSDTDTDLIGCQADGDDIVFFDSDNTTQLPHEQELWNSTTGELVEWVGIEDATNVSYIVMYYNNSTIANSENATGVWDSNYMIVQHFKETDIDGGAGDIKDSTSNDNDGNTHNMTTANLDTGLINGCFNFSVSNEARVNVTDDATLDGFTTGFTISGVFNFNQEGAYYLVNKYDAGGDQRAWLLKLQGNDNLRIYVDDAGTAAEISNFNPTIVPGTDYKIDAVWESGEYPLLYFDGALANEVDHDGLVSSIKDSSAILRIGGGYSPGDTFFTGDEIRVSNIARSHAYIETDYNNTAHPDLFISIGAEQGGGTPDTKYEYWDGNSWEEGPSDYYLWFTCFWWTPECANAEQSGSQATLKISNNGTASGTPKMKLNESAPAGIRIFVDDDNTFSGAVELSNTYQAVSTSLSQDTNITLWAWANLSGAPSWEFETEAIIE